MIGDFWIGMILIFGCITVLVLWFRHEFHGSHYKERFNDEMHEFFENMQWFGEEIDCEEMLKHYSSIEELKKANKRMKKIRNKSLV